MFMTVYVSNWAEYMVNQATGSAGHPVLLSPPTAIGHALVHQPAVLFKKPMATVDSTQIFFWKTVIEKKHAERKTREFWKISVPIRCLSLSLHRRSQGVSDVAVPIVSRFQVWIFHYTKDTLSTTSQPRSA